jgi:hypothetical protein
LERRLSAQSKKSFHRVFGRGFAVGILITLISSACYVGTWEIVYYKFMPGLAEKYAAHMVETAKASGASQQKLDETEQKQSSSSRCTTSQRSMWC